MNELVRPAPGALEIRPSRSRVEHEPEQFYSLLEALRGPDTLPLRKIAELTGDTSLNPEPNTLRKIRNRTLSEEARRFLLRHIFEDEQLLNGKRRRQLHGIEDAFYFAFLNHFQVCDTIQDETRAALVGTYQFWRYAADHDDEYLVGRMTVSEDPVSRALRSDIHVKQSGIQRADVVWHLKGYLFSLDKTFLMVTCRAGADDIRVTFLPRAHLSVVGTDIHPRSVFAGRHQHIVHMDGVTIGLERESCFLSPIHISLVDDVDDLARLDASLDVMSEDDPRLPRRIVKRLRRAGPLKWL